MSVWREARGVAEQVWGAAAVWLGAVIGSRTLLTLGATHLSQGSHSVHGAATRQVKRRNAVILKRLKAIKTMRSHQGRP